MDFTHADYYPVASPQVVIYHKRKVKNKDSQVKEQQLKEQQVKEQQVAKAEAKKGKEKMAMDNDRDRVTGTTTDGAQDAQIHGKFQKDLESPNTAGAKLTSPAAVADKTNKVDKTDKLDKAVQSNAPANIPSIGEAWLEKDGSITLNLRGDATGAAVHGQFNYKTSDKDFKDVLKHLNGIKPGEIKKVPPWEN